MTMPEPDPPAKTPDADEQRRTAAEYWNDRRVVPVSPRALALRMTSIPSAPTKRKAKPEK